MRNILLLFALLLSIELNSQINFFQKNIDTTTIYDLIYLNNKILTDKEILNNLTTKISDLQTNYYNEKSKLVTIENNLNIYKKLLLNYIKFYYLFKLNNSSTAIFLYTSSSLNNYYSNINYLKLNIKYIKKVTTYIKLLKISYSYRLDAISNYKKSITYYLNNYQNLKNQLDSSIVFYYNQSKVLQQNEQNIRKLIEKDYQEFTKIENTIIKNANNNYLNMNVDNAIENTLKFISPIFEPILISSFGEHNHSIYKNVKVKNDGIDITSKTDTIVKSIEEGSVVAIIKLKNNGYSVILKHKNNFFSVYSNLSFVYVKQNQNLGKQEKIGLINPSTSKYSFACLNIQLWYNTTKLDPQKYININNE